MLRGSGQPVPLRQGARGKHQDEGPLRDLTVGAVGAGECGAVYWKYGSHLLISNDSRRTVNASNLNINPHNMPCVIVPFMQYGPRMSSIFTVIRSLIRSLFHEV